MSTIRLQRMPIAPAKVSFVLRIISVLLALLTTAIVLWATGRDPIALGGKVISSTFGSTFGLEDLSLLLSPLIYCGLAVAVALRIGAWNIGAEGQFNFGAFCAAGIALFVPGPTWLILILMMVAGAIGGALWILIPTLARAYADVSELITTLLMNFVAMLLVYWVATGPWLDPSGMALATTARLPVSVPPVWGIVHWGLPIGIILAFALALFFTYTRWGYEVRIAGANAGAASYAGMPVKTQLIGVMLLSGAIAGLGGMMEVAGTVGRLQGGISNNYGYIGIMVAVLARAAPLGVLATAFFMAVILNGGIILQSQGLTTHTVLAVTGLILLYAAIGDEAAHYKVLRTKTGES
ncbi:ABC transporter permease [Celeribacter litoreus]|uniref:ABC transporter permease n=1 Tax=Celeribacter litoreus TaxID=2876714 RepID=UPI001CC9BCC1|nr:ABC transporter permease [Celeribacter litoreus]MCA0044938.1 ABC transporter permease [Celeribacter litoreus]